MIKMKLWKNAFDTWKNFCPFYKRDLITKQQMVSFASNVGIIRSTYKKNFLVYLLYLEESEQIHPLNTKEINLSYYHPLQFFDILKKFKHTPFRRPPYHVSKEFSKYFEIRKLKLRIQEQKKRIKSMKRLGLDTEIIEQFLVEMYEEYENMEGKDDFELNGVELIRKVKIYSWTHPLIDEKALIAWIKIESLLFNQNPLFYGKINLEMRIQIRRDSDQNELTNFYNKFKRWRDEIFQNPTNNSLTQEEVDSLKELHQFLYSEINEGDFPHNGNWWDLFDIFSKLNLDKIKGFSLYYVNLIAIKRYIERVFWELLQQNLASPYRSNEKPYFCVSPQEYSDYKRSILIKFNLLVDNLFILYVDGETEKTIIDEYQSYSKLRIYFNVLNMTSQDKAGFFQRMSEIIIERVIYFFFDYDNYDKYKRNKEKYGANNRFFFPDFITENFTPDQFLNSLKEWLDSININLFKDDEEIINNLIQNAKKTSDRLIERVNNNEEIKEKNLRNPKGYEGIVASILMKKYALKLHKKYPDMVIINHFNVVGGKDKDKFNQLFKREISERIKHFVIDSITEDPERKNYRFPFENKLEPFFSLITDAINKTPYSL